MYSWRNWSEFWGVKWLNSFSLPSCSRNFHLDMFSHYCIGKWKQLSKWKRNESVLRTWGMSFSWYHLPCIYIFCVCVLTMVKSCANKQDHSGWRRMSRLTRDVDLAHAVRWNWTHCEHLANVCFSSSYCSCYQSSERATAIDGWKAIVQIKNTHIYWAHFGEWNGIGASARGWRVAAMTMIMKYYDL